MALHSEHLHSPSLETDSRSILVVDDETGVRDLMSRWLQAGGYSVASASGADEALGAIERQAPAVALCDIRMPGRDGLWLADRIRQLSPETAVIMATGVHDVESAIAGLQHGVVDYLTKPFGRDRLRDAVTRGIEWHRSARDSRSWRERLEAEVEARRARLAAAIGSLSIDSDRMVHALLSMLTLHEADALPHARRVAELAAAIARMMGLGDDEIAVVRRAAMLHDVGKLAMPEALLKKPAPLTPEEQAIVRRCPVLGFELLADQPFLEEAAAIVREVRERPDGQGYPAGARTGIANEALIVAAADAYDTMTRPRVYRAPLDASEALLELTRGSGSQFDAAVVRTLKRLVAAH